MNASREGITGIVGADVGIVAVKSRAARADTSGTGICGSAGIGIIAGLPFAVRGISTICMGITVIVDAVSADFCRSTTRVSIFITWLRRTGIPGMFAGAAQASVGTIAKKAIIARGKIIISAVQNTACRIAIGIADPQVAVVIEAAAIKGGAGAYSAGGAGILGRAVVPVITGRTRINRASADAARAGV
jgi:hypothetical protein